MDRARIWRSNLRAGEGAGIDPCAAEKNFDLSRSYAYADSLKDRWLLAAWSSYRGEFRAANGTTCAETRLAAGELE